MSLCDHEPPHSFEAALAIVRNGLHHAPGENGSIAVEVGKNEVAALLEKVFELEYRLECKLRVEYKDSECLLYITQCPPGPAHHAAAAFAVELYTAEAVACEARGDQQQLCHMGNILLRSSTGSWWKQPDGCLTPKGRLSDVNHLPSIILEVAHSKDWKKLMDDVEGWLSPEMNATRVNKVHLVIGIKLCEDEDRFEVYFWERTDGRREAAPHYGRTIKETPHLFFSKNGPWAGPLKIPVHLVYDAPPAYFPDYLFVSGLRMQNWVQNVFAYMELGKKQAAAAAAKR